MKKVEVNFQPINDNVLIDLPQIEDKTTGGLIKSPEQIEAESKAKQQDDFVVVVGAGELVKSIKVGHKVMVNAAQIKMIMIEGKPYGLITENFVLGHKIK